MSLYSYVLVPLATLIVQETKEKIYETALAVAEAVGVPVSTWQAGDPTRSLFHVEAEFLEALEAIVVGYIRSGFLDTAAEAAEDGTEASRGWLQQLAYQQFGVQVPAATQASTTVTLTNASANFYDDIAAGDITVKNSTTGKTYTNTTGGTLSSGPGTTLDITVVADEPGAESSAAAGEIDEMVTQLTGVTCTNALAAVGTDEQDPQTTVQQCRDKLGSLSPNGPKEAYSYVARNPELAGTTAVTRVRVYGASDTGDVTVYLAGPSGGVSEADRLLVEDAILTWATPICITPTVSSAANVPVDITYQAWIYKSVNKTAAEVEEEIEAALETMFSERPIGGDIIPPATTGKTYRSLIESTILETFGEKTFRVSVSTPSVDTDLDNGEVAALGTITATITLVTD